MTRALRVLGWVLAGWLVGCAGDSREPAADGSAETLARDTGPETARVDTGAACSPAPDQNGFYSSCAACPSPSDCDTVDINGNRRYACGCGGGCPCDLRCGSYRIPGTAITIGNICVR